MYPISAELEKGLTMVKTCIGNTYLCSRTSTWSVQRRSCSCHHVALRLCHRPRIKYLAWVHEPLWIQGLLDTLHHVNRIDTELLDQTLLLPETNSMFSLDIESVCYRRLQVAMAYCTGTFHVESEVDHVINNVLDAFKL